MKIIIFFLMFIFIFASMDITSILKELLFSHECVILPDFGGFITRNESAQFDRINYFFTPPRRIISFNPILKHDDGLITTEIATRKNLGYSEAKLFLSQEIVNMKKILSAQHFLLLPGLGKLTENNGIIEFTPQSNLNLDKELFGLPHFQARRVLPAQKEKETVSPFSEWQSYAAAVIFALSIGTASIYTNNSVINSQLGSFFPMEVTQNQKLETPKVTKVSLAKKEITPLKISIPDLPIKQSKEKVIIAEEPITTSKVKRYQVIGGSHKKYHKAMEQEASLRRNGYPNAIIIGVVNNFTMVAYETFDTREEALNLKRKLEKKGKDVFLRVQ